MKALEKLTVATAMAFGLGGCASPTVQNARSSLASMIAPEPAAKPVAAAAPAKAASAANPCPAKENVYVEAAKGAVVGGVVGYVGAKVLGQKEKPLTAGGAVAGGVINAKKATDKNAKAAAAAPECGK